MLIATVAFIADRRLTSHDVDLWISPILRGWWEGGQILSNDPPVGIDGRRAAATVHLPEPPRRSLSLRRTLPLTKALLEEAARSGFSGPEVEVVGRVPGSEPACACRAPSAFVIFTHACTNAPPVLCADCGATVPLYRLPPLPDAEEHNGQYADLLGWQRGFRRMDAMWLESGLGERFAHAQLSRPRSPLNREGQTARAALEERTGRRVLYYQWQGSIGDDDLPADRPCPSCGGRWRCRPNREAFGVYGYKCERCRLVSM